MEMSQGNSLYSYLKQTNTSFFFFYEIREQEDRTGPVWGAGSSGKREDVGRGCKKENMVQILCPHICKWKNDTRSNYSNSGEWEDKGE
jgi:hypothetical protein